jgi:hypothetical protein
MKNIIPVILLATFSQNVFSDDYGGDVDVSSFSVYGLKLGMNEKEALNEISKKTGLSLKEIENKVSVNEEYPIRGLSYSYGIRQYNIYIRSDKDPEDNDAIKQISATFMPALVGENIESVVAHVKYKIPATKANIKSSNENAISKWGKPSYSTSQTGVSYGVGISIDNIWCVLNKKRENNKQSFCEKNKPVISYSVSNVINIELDNMVYYKGNIEKIFKELKKREDEEAEKAHEENNKFDADF